LARLQDFQTFPVLSIGRTLWGVLKGLSRVDPRPSANSLESLPLAAKAPTVLGPWRAIRNLAFCAAPFLACNQTASTNTTYVPIASALVVNPADFLGTEPCSDEPGALRTYQATLFDVTEGEEKAKATPSSLITSCQTALLFESVTIGRRYIAKIDAYDRNDLSTPGRGKRGAVDPDGASVAPTWTTSCRGDYDDSFGAAGEAGSSEPYGVWVYEETRRVVRGCAPLERQAEPGPTGVAFNFADIFPSLSCGSEAEAFSVQLSPDDSTDDVNVGGAGGETSNGELGGALSGQGGASPGDGATSACDTPIRIFDLDPNRTYRFDLEVFAPGSSEAAWRTTCSVVTASGIERTPECEPFQSTSGD